MYYSTSLHALAALQRPNRLLTVLYVSAVAANGMPVGNDTTGTGTRSAPYLTFSKAHAVAIAGQKIVLNGVSEAAPTEYSAALTQTISKAIILDAEPAYAAALTTNAAQQRVLYTNPSTGGVIHVRQIVLDCKNSTLSAHQFGVQPTLYSVNFYRTKFKNFTTYGSYVVLPNAKVSAFYDHCLFEAGDCKSAVYCSTLIAGGLTLVGPSITLTAQNTSGHGGIIALATAAGGAFTCLNASIDITIKSGITGSGSHYGIDVENIPNVLIRGGSVAIGGVVSGHNGVPIKVSATPGAPINAGGFVVEGVAALNNSDGGMGIEVGEDDAAALASGYLNGGVVQDCSITGGDHTATSGLLHGIFNGSGANTIIRRNIVTNAGLGVVDKQGDGAKIYGNVFKDIATDVLRIKGAQNGFAKHNTAVITRSDYRARLHNVTANPTTGVNTSNYILDGNMAVWSGVSGTEAVNVDASQGVTITRSNYWLRGGASWDSSAFTIGSTNYSNVSAYIAAAETTAKSVDPQFVDFTAGNYDLAATSAIAALVPYDSNFPSDYLGRAFGSPGSVGAYQYQVD